MNTAHNLDMDADLAVEAPSPDDIIAPLPRVSIQVFTDTSDVARIVSGAAEDRRMSKAHVKVQTGGAPAAVEAYRNASTPNVIVIESRLAPAPLLELLDELAGQCDAGTRVVVIGHINDVVLYRDLMRRGVSDYLIAPLGHTDFIRSLSGLFGGEKGTVLGRTISVVGAKGGVGASTIAHNLAWTIAGHLDIETVICDFDLAFGTAGLDFNQDPPQGLVEAATDPDRTDAAMVDRLLTPCGDKLSLMAAPATLERTYDFNFRNYEPVLDHLRQSVPNIVNDIPHAWTETTRSLLVNSDEVVIVAEPDLANLRNTKNMVDNLISLRKHDRKPHLVINRVGMPKRPEIAVAEFAKAVGLSPIAIIPFDVQLFGTAANNGQMLADIQAKHKAVDAIADIMTAVTGKHDGSAGRRSPSASLLEPILARFRRKQA